jgi:hypothetical protein
VTLTDIWDQAERASWWRFGMGVEVEFKFIFDKSHLKSDSKVGPTTENFKSYSIAGLLPVEV